MAYCLYGEDTVMRKREVNCWNASPVYQTIPTVDLGSLRTLVSVLNPNSCVLSNVEAPQLVFVADVRKNIAQPFRCTEMKDKSR